MATLRKLTNPTVVWNNIPLAIVPNSFRYTEGNGERNSEAQSTGGNSVTMVASKNVETMGSMLMFALFPTEQNVEHVRQMSNNFDANLFSASEGAFSRAFQNAVLLTDPEVALAADGTIELEFKSAPAI